MYAPLTCAQTYVVRSIQALGLEQAPAPPRKSLSCIPMLPRSLKKPKANHQQRAGIQIVNWTKWTTVYYKWPEGWPFQKERWWSAWLCLLCWFVCYRGLRGFLGALPPEDPESTPQTLVWNDLLKQAERASVLRMCLYLWWASCQREREYWDNLSMPYRFSGRGQEILTGQFEWHRSFAQTWSRCWDKSIHKQPVNHSIRSVYQRYHADIGLHEM